MFEPRRGLVTTDAYLHGLTDDLRYIGRGGEIEYVGRDYFILRIADSDEVFLIKEEDYCAIEEGDFE